MVDLNVPVLRHEPLRDVHVAHDFDARHERGVKLLRRRRLFLQQAVHAIAQLQRVLERHQMNVAGPFAQRGGNDQIHQIDDRGFVGHHLDVLEIVPLADFGVLRVEVFDHFLHRHLIAIGDFLGDLRGRSLKFLHFQTAQKPDVVYHPLVAGSGGGDVN